MNFKHSNRRDEPSLDLTPLIDIIFLLLIFFLVTTTFNQKKNESPEAIPVNLPSGVSGTATRSDEPPLLLTVTSSGSVTVNGGSPLSDDVLINTLKSLHNDNPESIVLLRGDAGSSHGKIIEVLDKVKLSGFQKVNLVVQKESASSPPTSTAEPSP